LDNAFHLIDRNGNGKLDREEFREFVKYVMENRSQYNLGHIGYFDDCSSADENLENISDILFDHCDQHKFGQISFEEFKAFNQETNIQIHNQDVIKSLPTEVPKNCIFFIWILKEVTYKLFGHKSFPYDIIYYIVMMNAIMGEFTGLCNRCHQWHKEGKVNDCHTGTWHGMTYGEVLNKKFSLDLFSLRIADTGHFFKKNWNSFW